ncbi:hypothetical protein NO430_10430 [Xanthomonas oryzae pv. oryzae]|nr:hypothetical protein [Xanthomonas oryzae]UWI58931.1 hypothetical protein NO430_10430 [Xanthomonas oryzae pv. oryzae]
MDFVDDQVIACIHLLTQQQIHQPDRKTGQRQQPNRARMCQAPIGGPIQCPQEKCRSGAGQRRDNAGNHQPLGEMSEKVEVLGAAES